MEAIVKIIMLIARRCGWIYRCEMVRPCRSWGGKTDDAASLRNRLKVDDDREPTKDTRNLLLFLGSLSV